jgi:hypothetical protein
MLLSPLGLFHEFFRFHFHLLCAEHQAHDPAGTTSANHADLLKYLLTSFVSAGQRPFIRLVKTASSSLKKKFSVHLNESLHIIDAEG